MNKAEPQQQNTNSHILYQDFDYYEPATLDEAISLSNKFGSSARVLAGGTQMFTQMKMERDRVEKIVNISFLPGLDEIVQNEKGDLVLGSLVKIKTIADDPYIKANYTALAQSCTSFGSTQIEIMATIGGNICNGSPASDTVPALQVFDAQLVIKGPGGERKAPVNGFVLSPGKVDLKPGEIVTHVILPAPVSSASSLFFKITRVVADLAKASLAAYIILKDGKISVCRLAFGSVAPTPIRLPALEDSVTGKTFSAELAISTGKLAEQSIFPIDDVRSTAAYRRRVVNVMTHDAITTLCSQTHTAGHAPKFQKTVTGVPAKSASSTGSELSSGKCRDIELTINGKKQTIRVKPNDLLLTVLREQLHLTGTKYGCGIGECSACTVLLNQQPILSCLMLAISAEGQDITTIEGLQKPDGTLDPLQESFIENGAFQCGYCTPGIIMTLKGLLSENAKPEEDMIREYLKGNRCRCTGYSSIVRAVMATLE